MIHELLEAKEGEQVQFKEAKNRFDMTEASKICCALANSCGGKFVLGITDQRPRQVVGSGAFDQPERARNFLMDKLKIRIDFLEYDYHDKRVLIFNVASRPCGLPVQCDGTAWWYDGDRLVPMPEEIRRSIYDETGFDFSGSVCAGANLSDLDENAVENFRRRWIEKSGNKRLKTLSVKQLLKDCGAVTDEGVTYAALILFGKHASLGKFLPQAETVFEYRFSDASGPAGQREEFREGFFSYYDRIWDLINLRNDKQHYQEGFFILDVPTFNERVIREAVLNAVSHRNYQMGGSIFIRQYRDRLVVESPGGFPFGISLDNILDRQSSRNRLIAEILGRCGLVERSGQGMNIIYELSIKEAKQLPDFTGTGSNFVCLTLNGIIIDKNMLSVINRIGEEQLEILSTNDFLTINALYHGETLSKTLKPGLARLTEMGIIEHSGRNKYILARRLYAAAGKTGTYTRKVGLDRETNKELILKHIRDNGDKGTPFRELQQVLPNLSRSQIIVLLRELKQNDRIYMQGKNSGARWFIRSD